MSTTDCQLMQAAFVKSVREQDNAMTKMAGKPFWKSRGFLPLMHFPPNAASLVAWTVAANYCRRCCATVIVIMMKETTTTRRRHFWCDDYAGLPCVPLIASQETDTWHLSAPSFSFLSPLFSFSPLNRSCPALPVTAAAVDAVAIDGRPF